MSKIKYTSAGNRLSDFKDFENSLDYRTEVDWWLKRMSVHVNHVYAWDLEPHFEEGPNTCPDINFMLVKEGVGEVVFQNPRRSFGIRPGDALFYPPGSVFVNRFPGHERAQTVCVHFDAKVFGCLNIIQLLNFPQHLPAGRLGALTALFDDMAREFHLKGLGWQVFLNYSIVMILMRIIRQCGDLFGRPLSVTHVRNVKLLAPSMQMIETDLKQSSLRVSDLAERVHLSESHFRLIFQKSFGISPLKFIQQRRIERACLLLLDTPHDMNRIAEMCGFHDSPHFSRLFKSHIGQTPGEYRKTISW